MSSAKFVRTALGPALLFWVAFCAGIPGQSGQRESAANGDQTLGHQGSRPRRRLPFLAGSAAERFPYPRGFFRRPVRQARPISRVEFDQGRIRFAVPIQFERRSDDLSSRESSRRHAVAKRP